VAALAAYLLPQTPGVPDPSDFQLTRQLGFPLIVFIAPATTHASASCHLLKPSAPWRSELSSFDVEPVGNLRPSAG